MPYATAPTKDGYTFGGYFTSRNGQGTKYYSASMSSSRTWDKTVMLRCMHIGLLRTMELN